MLKMQPCAFVLLYIHKNVVNAYKNCSSLSWSEKLAEHVSWPQVLNGESK